MKRIVKDIEFDINNNTTRYKSETACNVFCTRINSIVIKTVNFLFFYNISLFYCI